MSIFVVYHGNDSGEPTHETETRNFHSSAKLLAQRKVITYFEGRPQSCRPALAQKPHPGSLLAKNCKTTKKATHGIQLAKSAKRLKLFNRIGDWVDRRGNYSFPAQSSDSSSRRTAPPTARGWLCSPNLSRTERIPNSLASTALWVQYECAGPAASAHANASLYALASFLHRYRAVQNYSFSATASARATSPGTSASRSAFTGFAHFFALRCPTHHCSVPPQYVSAGKVAFPSTNNCWPCWPVASLRLARPC